MMQAFLVQRSAIITSRNVDVEIRCWNALLEIYEIVTLYEAKLISSTSVGNDKICFARRQVVELMNAFDERKRVVPEFTVFYLHQYMMNIKWSVTIFTEPWKCTGFSTELSSEHLQKILISLKVLLDPEICN
jgi:hypothetical protein